jgi:hypothetical protein
MSTGGREEQILDSIMCGFYRREGVQILDSCICGVYRREREG